MDKVQRNKIITELKQSGFKAVKGHRDLYVNKSGKLYNIRKSKYLTPCQRNNVSINSKKHSLPKLMIHTFKGEPIRTGQIMYIDGNKTNLDIDNIRYSRKFSPDIDVRINKPGLLTAIRCYFEVPNKFKLNNTLTKYYIKTIVNERLYFVSKKYTEIFNSYLSGQTVGQIAKTQKVSFRDCSIIVNLFINQLINEILLDLQKGILHIKEFQPKPPTKAHQLKEYNKKLIRLGGGHLTLIRETDKEKLKEYKKRLNNMK